MASPGQGGRATPATVWIKARLGGESTVHTTPSTFKKWARLLWLSRLGLSSTRQITRDTGSRPPRAEHAGPGQRGAGVAARARAAGPPGIAERAAAGGDAGLGGAAAAGRGLPPRGAQLLLAPRSPKAIGETCNRGTGPCAQLRSGQLRARVLSNRPTHPHPRPRHAPHGWTDGRTHGRTDGRATEPSAARRAHRATP